LFTESFSIDGGKVAMAQQPATGGETVMNQHGPHSRGAAKLKKYPEIAFHAAEDNGTRKNDFETTEFTANVLSTPEFFFQGGYKITGSGSYNSNYYPYRLFDQSHLDYQSQDAWYTRNTVGTYTPYYNGSPVINLGTASGGTATTNGEYVAIEMPKKICVKKYILYGPNTEQEFPQDWTIYGSNDGVEWASIDTQTNQAVGFHVNNGVQPNTGGVPPATATGGASGYIKRYSFTNTNYYNNYAIVITKSGGGHYIGLAGLEFYGYEEDPPLGDTSIDTTFKSIMNTPQTTGVQVYVDGNLGDTFTNHVVGPTVSNTHTTYVSAEKYWQLSGNVESNVTIEANTFLSGDAPHSLSMWFNSSNLEANASNSCIFSILNDQVKIHHEGVAYSNNYGMNWLSDKIFASDGNDNSRFGAGDGANSLGMSGDGSIVAVGANYDNSQLGAAHIFIKDVNGHWKEVQKLLASDGAAGDRFGAGVDISSDGNYIAIGARLAHSTDGNDTSNVGKLYIFKRTAGTNSWVEQQILSSSHESQDDYFGRRVSISSDGTYVVAGAQNDDESENNGGAAYVFKRTGNTWNTTPFRLITDDVADYDYIAAYIEISNDGNYIALGVSREEDGAQEDDDGSVYIFNRTGDNTWSQQQKISNPDVSGVNNYFGGENQGVSISSDGTYLIVGAYGRASNNGAVFFYKRTGSSWAIMGSTQTNPIGATGDLFGRAVKMSPDGTVALVHSRDNYTQNASYGTNYADAGAVFVYNRSGDTWTYSHKVQHKDINANYDNFGSVLAISNNGDYFAAGMWKDDDMDAESGSVYVFTRDITHYLDTDLKLQPNTWHNLTYTYGGGGGSKTMYIDGRKVSETFRNQDTSIRYPPHDRTTYYERNGYIISASSYHDGYEPYHLLDQETTHAGSDHSWISGNKAYNATDGTANVFYDTITFVDGVPRRGEWVQMKFPNRMKIKTVELAPQSDTENYRSPRDGIFCGSNDGIIWEKLHEYTGKIWVSGITWVDNRYESFVMDTNLDKGYKYIRFIIERTVASTTYESSYASLAEIRFFGHVENDIVRFPDPTNVVKFPHIPLRTHAQRGYVVSVPVNAGNGYNTVENVNQDRRAWMAFDGNTGSTDNTIWQMGDNSHYTNGSGDATSHAPIVPGHTTRGGWVKLELPNKVLLSKIRVHSQNAKTGSNGSEGVNSAKIYGSNNDTSWDVIKDTYALNFADTSVTVAEDTISTSTAYKYIIFQITKTGGGPGGCAYEIEYYGIEKGNSVPIQIGGGNIDKIANFRIYNRSIDEDQALEIWDSQKDQFREVKSSMTLYKGRLGLGTTEPEGHLSILDEPHVVEEFPPGPFTDYTSYFDGYGLFSVSASSYNKTGNGGTYNAWKVFQSNYVGGGGWLSEEYYDSASGLAREFSDNIYGKRGEWLQLRLPFKIRLQRTELHGRAASLHPRSPRNVTIWGSNDSTNWEELKVFTCRYPAIMDYSSGNSNNNVVSDPSGNVNYVGINSTKAYSIFRVQIHNLHVTVHGSDTGAAISRWRLFGTREQSQSTWNDGELITTKSLSVPRIGPSLGYQIPNRDKLVVEYDTSLPIHKERPIDTSGNSHDGSFSGHVNERSWDADRSFSFDGSGDFSTTTINTNGGGDWIHSISFWFKLQYDQLTGTAATNGYSRIDPFTIGAASTSQYSSCDITTNRINWYFYGNDANYDISGVRAGDWHHIVFAYGGGGNVESRHCYFDGVEYKNVGTGVAPLNIPSSATLTLGCDGGRRTGASASPAYFAGDLAKFRVYNCTLTLSEAIQLYKEGSKTSPHHLQLVNSTMTIGNHDRGGAESAQLDVAGHIRAGGAQIHSFTGQHRCFPDEPMEKGLIVSAKKNQFVKLNGFATGQDAITIDESLPIISLSNVAQDKACFGVVSSIEKSTPRRSQNVNGIISDAKKESGDNRAIVNSLGEGAIWVVDTGGALESGDYITTSNVTGYGQKQNDDVLHNYTVAKITMDCDFTGSSVAVQTIKREETGTQTIMEDIWNQLVDYDRSSNTETQYSNTLAPSAYSDQSGYTPREVTTIVDYTDGSNIVSIAEWSNLESNIQNTYQSNTFTEIVDYTKFVSLSEWSNLTTDVQNTFSEAEITTYYQIQRGENVLDENGQLQFEDKTGATEAPYERRFLDASGVETDSANAVHIAAFVGCTYHCG
jgi:hypothetical protein